MTISQESIPKLTVKHEEMNLVEAGVVTFGVVHREFTIDSLTPYLCSPGVQDIIDRINNEGFFDQGVSVYVFQTGTKRDYLRFDCFEVEPHYHYHHLHSLRDAGAEIVLGHQEIGGHAASVTMNGFWHQVPFDSAANGDIRAWTLDRLHDRLPEMLAEAGEEEFAKGIDEELVHEALERVRPLVYAEVDRT